MNRGTEAVWQIKGGIALLCDCGTVTNVGFEMPPGSEHAAVADQEVAVTCDTCGSAHWLTITGSGPDADEPVVTA
jgi:hypothetical protein